MRRWIWIGGAGVCLAMLLACGGTSSSDGGHASGGSAGSGASSGSGDDLQTQTDKVDLLVVVDNSMSMADKQQMLAVAMPRFIDHLLKPPIDPVLGTPGFLPITDMHLGVITSSLGGHGSESCSDSKDENDHAHLLPTVRAGIASPQGQGFLSWDANGSAGGIQDQAELIAAFSEQIVAAGEFGCGYEAPLEAMYRFLVEPAPPLQMVVDPLTQEAKPVGHDEELLEQRRAFLRTDSALVVVLLSDENDCSIVDSGSNWVATHFGEEDAPFHLPRGTSACATNPDDPCCRSCGLKETEPPNGCTALADDVECQKGLHDDATDLGNLRCWDQKRRFGRSFLYPTERYVDGLSLKFIPDRWDENGPAPGAQMIENPIFAGKRGPGLVVLTSLVGVPWQDLADEKSLASGDSLSLRSSATLDYEGRWSWLLESSGEPPLDPLMIEATAPRHGKNPATGDPLAPPSAGVLKNPINGHEWLTDDDLEYACIYPLAKPLGGGSDCIDPFSQLNPLCQDPATGEYSVVQFFAKAYPGVRELEVIRDLGSQGVVASICAKASSGNGGSSAFGYNAAVEALERRLDGVLIPPP